MKGKETNMHDDQKQEKKVAGASYPVLVHPAGPHEIDEERDARVRLHERIVSVLRAQWAHKADPWWLELCTRSAGIVEHGGEEDPMIWARAAVEACPEGEGARYAVCTDLDTSLSACLDHMGFWTTVAVDYLTKETSESMPELSQLSGLGSEQRLRLAYRALREAFDVAPSVVRAMGSDASLTEERCCELSVSSAGNDSAKMLEACEQLESLCKSVTAAVDKQRHALNEQVKAVEAGIEG